MSQETVAAQDMLTRFVLRSEARIIYCYLSAPLEVLADRS
jgi:hypothetical protein